MPFDQTSGYPTDNSLSDSNINLRVFNLSNDIEAANLNDDYQPLLPETPIDCTISKIFIQNAHPGKEALAGRAIPGGSPIAGVGTHQSSDRETPLDVAPAPRTPSPPRFVRDPDLSWISRGLATKPTSHYVPPKEEQTSIDSSDSVAEEIIAHTTRKLRHRPTTKFSNIKELLMRTKLASILVAPIDAEYTVIKVNDEHYKILNSEAWLYPYEKDRLIPAHRLAQLIRPSFLFRMRKVGPQKTIEEMNGHELLVFGAEAIPRDPNNSIDPGAASARDILDVIFAVPLEALRISGECALDSIEADIDLEKNTSSDIPFKNTIVEGSAEMDGTGLERTPGQLLSPVKFTGTPAFIFRSGSPAGSAHSVKTIRSSKSDSDSVWDAELLVEFTNTVRAAIHTSEPIISAKDIEYLKSLLEQFLADEWSPQACEKLGLEVITQARLDNLLEDLINMKRVNVEYDGLVAQAESVKRMWTKRFKTDYFLIDKERFETMMRLGALRGLTLEVNRKTEVPVWRVQKGSPIADADLTMGHWWLNIHCVYRDGVVESTKEKLTIGGYGATVLPLLTGEEEDGSAPGMYTYHRQGKMSDMHLKLMPMVGSKIRILRGSDLVSKYAPEAGVRYDGEYHLRIWRHLPLDLDTKVYRLELLLERVPGQLSVDSLQSIPNPCQLDEWYMYQRYIQSTARTRGIDLVNVAQAEWKLDEVFE